MTAPDDIRVGMHVAIVGIKRHEEQCGCCAQRPTFNGQPLQVIAVSLPFLCVEDPTGDRHGLDVRLYQLQKLTPRFVKAMTRPKQACTQPDSITCMGGSAIITGGCT